MINLFSWKPNLNKDEDLQRANQVYDKKVQKTAVKNAEYTVRITKQWDKYEAAYNRKKQKLDAKNSKDAYLKHYTKQFEAFCQRYETKIAMATAANNQGLIDALTKRYAFIKKQKYQTKSKIIANRQELYDKRLTKLNEEFELAKLNFEQMKLDAQQGDEKALANLKNTIITTKEKKWQKREFRKLYKAQRAELKNLKNGCLDHKSMEYKNLKFQMRNLSTHLYHQQQWLVKPFKIAFQDWATSLVENAYLKLDNIRQKCLTLRTYTWKEWVTIKIWSIPIYLYLAMLAIVIVAIAVNALDVTMLSAMAVLFVIAIIGGTIFSHIPIWNKYIGGGVMGSMFVGAILVATNAIPKTSETYQVINMWFSKQDFLSFYISILLVGAVLTIPRKMIIKSLSGFIGLIVVGCVFAVGIAIFFGYLTGVSIQDTIIRYLLPTLCDGNGGGIQPMDKIAMANGYYTMGADGVKHSTWISGALAISTLSSILSVIFSALLNGLGKVRTGMSGNGSLVQRAVNVIEPKIAAKDRNVAAGLILVVTLYVFSNIIAKKVLPESVIGINVPNFAWMIIICLILNLTNLVPQSVRAGTAQLNKFVSKQMTWVLMLGVGIVNIDLATFIKALNGTSFLICLGIILGVIIGPMLLARFIKFYQVESAISAGLCMSAQGGSGAIACLGASNRMELMPYSQITCRIAGSIVLIFASVAFSVWPMVH